MSRTDGQWEKGLELLDQVYGPGYSQGVGADGPPYMREVVGNLFGNIWANDALSIRDKRLMALGATAILGRADLIEIQMTGALINGEFDEAQLEQIPLFLLFYAGAGNTSAVIQGMSRAREKYRENQSSESD